MSLEREAMKVRTTSLGWMIQRLARRLNQAMEERLSRHDLTLRHFIIMMTALESDGLSQTEIGYRFDIPPYAISRAIDYLETRGLVVRKAHPTSRRTHTIHATAQGRTLGQDLFAIVRSVNDELAAPLTVEERTAFKGLLEKVLKDTAAVE